MYKQPINKQAAVSTKQLPVLNFISKQLFSKFQTKQNKTTEKSKISEGNKTNIKCLYKCNPAPPPPNSNFISLCNSYKKMFNNIKISNSAYENVNTSIYMQTVKKDTRLKNDRMCGPKIRTQNQDAKSGRKIRTQNQDAKSDPYSAIFQNFSSPTAIFF